MLNPGHQRRFARSQELVESDERPRLQDIEIERAGVEDMPAILHLVEEDLTRQGVVQRDNSQVSAERIRQDLSEGSIWIASHSALGLIGLVAVDEQPRPEYASASWSEVAVRSAVIHRLVIAPAVQVYGLAELLIVFAEQLAVQRGCDAIRLDASVSDRRALRLFSGLEYREAGDVMLRDGLFRCFEKRLVLAMRADDYPIEVFRVVRYPVAVTASAFLWGAANLGTAIWLLPDRPGLGTVFALSGLLATPFFKPAQVCRSCGGKASHWFHWPGTGCAECGADRPSKPGKSLARDV